MTCRSKSLKINLYEIHAVSGASSPVYIMLLFLDIVAYRPANILAIDYMKRTAVIPAYHNGGDIVHAKDGTTGADRRCLYIVHFYKFHTSTYRVSGAYALHQFS